MSAAISLCFITLNEEKNLRECVESFRGAFDELVIVDTGSTDKTKEIAVELGAKLVDMKWENDFAAARNLSFESASGDWLMWAEPDERLEAGHAEKIRKVVAKTTQDVHAFTQIVGGEQPVLKEKLIRRGFARWERKVHERLISQAGAKCAQVEAIVVHHPRIKEESHVRNVAMLQAGVKDTPADLFFLATEMFAIGNKEKARTFAKTAIETGGLPEIERYELLLHLGANGDNDAERIRYFSEAYTLMPYRREALAALCKNALSRNQDMQAYGFAKSMMALNKPPFPIWTLHHRLYGWIGLVWYCYTLRRNGWYLEALQAEQKARGGQLPNIALIHATRGRPQKMIETRDLFYDRADAPHLIEHVFVIDADDHASIEAARGYAHEIIEPGGGCVAAWNFGAAESSGKILVQLSDDWVPPQGWDRIIMERIRGDSMDEKVLAVSDGIDRGGGEQTKCLCMAIMTRGRLQAQGTMFHPSYRSVYSDNEFTERAYEDGVVIEARDVVFQHVHPLTGKVPTDATYQESNAPERYQMGEQNFLIRKMKRQNKTGLDRDYAAFILTTGDDFCLQGTCDSLVKEGVKKIYFGIPSEYWNGRAVGEDAVKILGAEGDPRIKIIRIDVQKHRLPGCHILDTEARVRNAVIEIIRRDGWQHIVVADDDELWLPGTLREIDDYVSDNFPQSMCLRMIPVIGVPGYPVEGAQDVAMVYLGPSGQFSSSRSAAGIQHISPRRKIIHFSATRRTLDEVIEKSRLSGHYTDPDYDFENWIRNILPNVNPGSKDVHMFRRWSTWPLVREWTVEEWAAIPDSIKPHLGEPKKTEQPSKSEIAVGRVSEETFPVKVKIEKEEKKMNSQNDEEKYILEFFGDKTDGRLLDIGAYVADTFSNTRALIDRGWSGVLVEPSPRCFVKLMESYRENPQIVLVNALVGPTIGLMKFHDSMGANATAVEDHFEKWAPLQKDYQTIYVPVLRVNPLCKLVGKADFVNIDTEGMDWEILQVLPLDEMGTRLVCVEYGTHGEDMQKFFEGRGWKYIMNNGENMIWGKP